jgi:predicted NBD/HSP70 family sugar kinase
MKRMKQYVGRGSNVTKVRQYNERAVLTQLRRMKEASKKELAIAVGMTPQALTGIVDKLAEAGLVRKLGRRLGGIGQPSLIYAINPLGAYSIGINIGRRSLEILLVNFMGEIKFRILHEYEFPSYPETLSLIRAGLETLHQELTSEESQRLTGIGVAAPFFLSSWQRELGVEPMLLQEWSEVDLTAEVKCISGLPVYTENDCSAAAAAELLFGHGQHLNSFIYVFIGTLTGGGLVLNGNLETGANRNAAALGPMPVSYSKLNSIPQPSAPYDTLLNRASIHSLIRHLRHNGIRITNVSELPKVLDSARGLVQEWMDDCINALIFALLSIYSVIDVEATVIDSDLPGFLLQEILETLKRRLTDLKHEGIFLSPILDGQMGRDASAIGGATLPLYFHFAPDCFVLTRSTHH